MKYPFVIGIYWKSRKQNASECTNNVLELLRILRKYDLFSDMYKLIKSSKKSLEAGPINTEDFMELENFIRKSVQKNEMSPPEIIEDLGYNFSLWNGKRKQDVYISFTVGSYSPFIVNHVLINFYENHDFVTYENACNILKSLIDIFNPDIGMVSIYGLSSILAEPLNKYSYSSGWILYRRELVNIPKSINLDAIAYSNGVLISATREIFDSENAQHISAFVKIAEMLGEIKLNQ